MSTEGVLRRLEWGSIYSYCTGWPCCPICKGIQPGYGADEEGCLPDNQGHREDCDLAEAIAIQIESKEILVNLMGEPTDGT